MNNGEKMENKGTPVNCGKGTLGLDGLSRLTGQKAKEATDEAMLSMDEQEKAWIDSLITHLEQTIDWDKINGKV